MDDTGDITLDQCYADADVWCEWALYLGLPFPITTIHACALELEPQFVFSCVAPHPQPQHSSSQNSSPHHPYRYIRSTYQTRELEPQFVLCPVSDSHPQSHYQSLHPDTPCTTPVHPPIAQQQTIHPVLRASKILTKHLNLNLSSSSALSLTPIQMFPSSSVQLPRQ